MPVHMLRHIFNGQTIHYIEAITGHCHTSQMNLCDYTPKSMQCQHIFCLRCFGWFCLTPFIMQNVAH